MKHKDLEGARLYHERALEIKPNDVETLKELLRITALLKDKEAAAVYDARLKKSFEALEAETRKGDTVGEGAEKSENEKIE